MNFYISTILFIVFDQVNKSLTQGFPISPCPKIFQYRFDGAEWFGLLSVRNPEFGQALHLKVTLSMVGKPTTNYLGEIELLTRGQHKSDTPILYKVKFPKNNFPPKLVQISANNRVVCRGAALDHQGILVTQIQLEHTRKFTFLTDDIPLAPDLTVEPPPPASSAAAAVESAGVLPGEATLFSDIGFVTEHWLPNEKRPTPQDKKSKDICGKIDNRIRFQVRSSKNTDADQSSSRKGLSGHIPVVTSDELFSDSTQPAQQQEQPLITRGAWPWLAAIYVNNLTSLGYQCAGTLISSRIVISAAHCFHMFKRLYTANEILVFLGRHNLRSWNEEESLAAPCDDIFIHPDYDSNLNSYDADVAVVILKHEVRFNTYIRPACLWSGSTKSEFIEGEQGIVVGWGLGSSPDGKTMLTATSTVPKITYAPIVSNDVCFKADDKFRSLSSNRTFCAGKVESVATAGVSRRHDGAGPCAGDSGAGLMIFINRRWVLRGTVSASLPMPITSKDDSSNTDGSTNPSCNFNQYVIYTDVAKFLDWIIAFTL